MDEGKALKGLIIVIEDVTDVDMEVCTYLVVMYELSLEITSKGGSRRREKNHKVLLMMMTATAASAATGSAATTTSVLFG